MFIRLDQVDPIESIRCKTFFERKYSRQASSESVQKTLQRRASSSTSIQQSVPAQPRARPSYIVEDTVISDSDEEDKQDLELDDQVIRHLC